MTAMLEQVPFPPTGDTLWARRDDDGRIFVAVKPICEAIGLKWHSQFMRIKRTASLSEGILMMRTPSAGGEQMALCLPLDLIPGWLFGVDVNRVKPDLRDRLIAYQRECHRVLFEHFKGDLDTALMADDEVGETHVLPAGPPCEGFGMPESTINLWLRIIGEARLLKGREAACRVWQGSPLASLAPLDAAAPTLAPAVDWATSFMADCLEEARGARLSSDALWRAYLGWCGSRDFDPVSRNAFGRAMGERLRTTKSSSIYYLNVRLK